MRESRILYVCDHIVTVGGMQWSLALLLLSYGVCSLAHRDIKPAAQVGVNDVCAEVQCSAGSECHVVHGIATCQCAPSCPRFGTQVCASDGRSYRNQCEVHKVSCRRGLQLRVVNTGPCPRHHSTAGQCKVARQRVLHSRLSRKDVLRTSGCAGGSLSAAQWQRCLQASGVLGAVTKHIKREDKECARCFFSMADVNADQRLTSGELSALLTKKLSTDICGQQCKDEDLSSPDCRSNCVCSVGGRWKCSSAECNPAHRIKQKKKLLPRKHHLIEPHVKKHRMKLVKGKEWDDLE